MKILMINKFLYPNGGSETYIFELGKQLEKMGHEVQYFGMEHEGRCVGNRVGAYTSSMDFHGGSRLAKLTYPLKTIYSSEARQKLRLVLDDFRPDVIHLNNFNYQLTPGVLLEADKWRRESGQPCRILYTAHDYQLVCPNHMCCRVDGQVCEDCLSGKSASCIRHKCIHGSAAKSAIGAAEAAFWRWKKVYKKLDAIVCCSEFMKKKLDTDPILRGKTVALHNFISTKKAPDVEKQDYVLYFGRFAKEKGVETFAKACKALPDIPFVAAGSGPLEGELAGIPNLKNVGFQSGEALQKLIAGARFSVYPSEWYENCPFSVMESLMYGTPVLGADIGGIPELIDAGENGELFESGNADALAGKIRALWGDRTRLDAYTKACGKTRFDTVEAYAEKLMRLYQG